MRCEVASLWIGKRLSEIELASIRSFQRLGHSITLFVYSKIENCPSDVRIRDASEILSGDRILRYKRNGSPALHANLFRYAMVQQTDFTWVDLDIIALRPFEFESGFIFGYESDMTVNNAVLRLPVDSPTLERLLTYSADTRGMPPNLKSVKRFKYLFRNAIAGGLPIDRWPWGSLGPTLLTSVLSETGEILHALPVSAFYSIPPEKVAIFADPNGYSETMAPADAYAVHLWGKFLREYVSVRYGGTFPDDSFVARIARDR